MVEGAVDSHLVLLGWGPMVVVPGIVLVRLAVVDTGEGGVRWAFQRTINEVKREVELALEAKEIRGELDSEDLNAELAVVLGRKRKQGMLCRLPLQTCPVREDTEPSTWVGSCSRIFLISLVK
jgi:hypothetical protein